MTKIPAVDFAAWCMQQADDKCGYIMGACGQDPKTWPTDHHRYTQYTGAQLKKALYWREHAPRVFDCAGMAEAAVAEMLGIPLSKVDTKARYIYSDWCDEKGESKKTIPKERGVAVFIRPAEKGYITHIGYLVEPVDENEWDGDWWVVEARGVMYGVVRTKLSARPWNRWGKMTKYFDYSEAKPEKPDYRGYVKVTGSHVNIRRGPGIEYPVLDTVPKGTMLKPCDNADGWHAVQIDGEIGWISGQYSEVVK